jgi:hypothetical protein
MYLRRMKECGVEFGSWALSGQFWKIVEPMQSPMDFVSRLSLTFEQANLDYSKHFAKVFARIGDDETAAVLQKIYLDEIGHVQHGLDWFRKWKEPNLSDWDAYQQSLDFPMSPQRARGPNIDFNREGRLQAGLDEHFIDSVEVFRQSRGKAATLRWFDPGAESELAGSQSSRELALLEQLGRDLEMVMLPLCKPDDILLVRNMPSQQLRKHWIDAGFSLPEFRSYDDMDELVVRRLHDFAPWAWTPKSQQLIEPLIKTTRHSPPSCNEQQPDLYRKSWSVNRLRHWLNDERSNESCDPDWFADVATAGHAASCIADVTELVRGISRAGFATALIKQDLGTSGRGQRRIDCNQPLTTGDRQWIESALEAGPCVVEPELDRVLDLSFLWRLERDKAEVDFLGWTRPIVTRGRRYAGARLGDLFGNCDPDVRKFLLAGRCERLKSVASWLQDRLVSDLQKVGFEGPFGIDAMVYRDSEDQLRIKPMVELNPRMTMGHVALALGKRIAPGVDGEFRIFSRDQWQEFSDREEPSCVELNQSGQWKSGVIQLSEFSRASKFVPVVLVGEGCSGAL